MTAQRGQYNSSSTRIRPFFAKLARLEPTGEAWLPKLLKLFSTPQPALRMILDAPGAIDRMVFQTDTQTEHRAGPPHAFLEWLIKNPDQMVWPRTTFSPETTRLREDLFGRSKEDTAERQAKARELALKELSHHGSRGSRAKWWRFEGETSFDCFIQTSRLKIYVEGKRTELLSSSTAWFPQRSQLVRNLEAAQEDAEGTPFVCLILREKAFSLSPGVIDSGLPHLSKLEREALMEHYIGDASWQAACEATGISYAELPDTCSAYGRSRPPAMPKLRPNFLPTASAAGRVTQDVAGAEKFSARDDQFRRRSTGPPK